MGVNEDNNAQQNIEVLVDFDRQQRAAWMVFERQFNRENPEPERPRLWHWAPFSMLPYSVLGAGGAILSAMRTGPVFAYVASQFNQVATVELSQGLTNAEGLIATLVVDGAAIMFRFAMVIQARGDRQGQESAWVRRGFWLAFLAQVVSNLYANLGVATFVTGTYKDVADLFIMLVASLSGIVIAFATGDILGHQWVRSQVQRETLTSAFARARAERNELKIKQWNRRKSSYGVSAAVENPSVSVSASARTTRTGREREGDADGLPRTVLMVVEHLSANPDDAILTVRELAERLGVGKTSAANGKSAYLEASAGPTDGRENGHGEYN